MTPILRTLRRGDRGLDVLAAQERMIELKVLAPPADKGFGPLMEAGVRGFQVRAGLKNDGILGPITLSAMFVDAYQPGDIVVVTPRTPAQYAAKYRAAKITPSKLVIVQKRAALLKQFETKFYAPVALKCLGAKELWWVPALIHNQESGTDVGVFKAVLHNGEKIVGTNRKTSLVPAGKGPFATWPEAAIDALYHDGANKRKAWDVGSALEFFERYNGLGYRNRGVASPYDWAMTDQYTSGHFGEVVVNGRPKSTFYPDRVNKNYGCASIMMALGIK